MVKVELIVNKENSNTKRCKLELEGSKSDFEIYKETA